MAALPRFRRRVPFVPQVEAVECGAASLAMVLAYHGHHATLAEVRDAMAVSRDGSSALSIVRCARRYGFDAQGVAVDMEQLERLPLPAILHWGFNHFVVLAALSARGAEVVDPAAGRRSLEREELSRGFTGVAVRLAPGATFQRRRAPSRSLARYRAEIRQAVPNAAQVVVLSLCLQLLGLVLPAANRVAVDAVISRGQTALLPVLAAVLAAAFLVRSLITYVRGWLVLTLQAALDRSLMTGFLRHLFGLPYTFFLFRQPAELATRVHANVHLRNIFTTGSAIALLDGLSIAAAGLLLLAYSPAIAAVVAGALGARVLLWLARIRRVRYKLVAESMAVNRDGARLLETLASIEGTRAAGAELAAVAWAEDRGVDRVNLGLARRRVELLARHAMAALSGLSLALAVWVGGREVLDGRSTVGMVTSALMLQALMVAALDSLVVALSELQTVSVQLSRVDDVVGTAVESGGGGRPVELRGQVSLDDVSVVYNPDTGPVLAGVSLSVAPGELVAIVGPTGAGKSTLARVLLGLQEPTSGAVHFDGRPLRELGGPSVRREIGAVPQSGVLFDASILDNVLVGRPYSLAEVEEVGRLCRLDGVLASLPEGYAARVGEAGRRLSAGQRQRILLARALLSRPPLLILDEAMSALDPETEEAIEAALGQLACTRFVVTHRIHQCRRADQILVLDGGRIVQRGTWDELVALPGLFARLEAAMSRGQRAPHEA
jgi:ATP-binding cassette, subfamily B, bacterial